MGSWGLQILAHVVHPFGASAWKSLTLTDALIENAIHLIIGGVVDVVRPKRAAHTIVLDTVNGANVVNAATEKEGGDGAEDSGSSGVGHCSSPFCVCLSDVLDDTLMRTTCIES